MCVFVQPLGTMTTSRATLKDESGVSSAPPPFPPFTPSVRVFVVRLVVRSERSPAARRSPLPLAGVNARLADGLMAATRSDHHVAVFLEDDV